MFSSYDQNALKERVRDATDIVELVGHYIPLRRAGRNYVGRCPWHDDSRPSLQVNPERQTFKCWVCDIGGDVFAFIMKIENVDFREALEILADKAGIPLPTYPFQDNHMACGTEITKKQLFQVADSVAKLYHETLLHSPEAELAREYLRQRNIHLDAVKKFRIGYAPEDRNWLASKFRHQPEQCKMLELVGNFLTPKKEAGDLLPSSSRTRASTQSDFFHGRLIFPIRDEQGRTVAFGGRLIPNSPLSNDSWHQIRKYLNSSETMLFSKHKILYGLDSAKQQIKEVHRALIMEGYTDCVTAHAFGFSEAVAVLGTALSPSHIRLLNRMGAEKIILMFDGDKAGQAKAESNQILTDFIAQGADMAVLILPEGLDPSEFLEQYGADALNTLLETETVDVLEHVFRVKTRGIDLKNDIIAATNALNTILEIIAHAPIKEISPDDPVRLRIEKAVQNLSMRFRMPEDLVRRRLRENQQKAANRQTVSEELPARSVQTRWIKDQLPDPLERDMLELWMLDPTAVYAFWEHIFPEQLHSPITLLIYRQCSELVEQEGKPATFDNLMTAIDDLYVKNFLIELETSGRKKFFPDEENDLDAAIREERTERWKEPNFVELKTKLIEEILAAFDRRKKEQERRSTLAELRNDQLSDDEKMLQLLDLQKKLRGR